MYDMLTELGFTQLESLDFMMATERSSDCTFDALVGDVVSECASHARLVDHPVLRRLLFGRRLAERWRSGEFQERSRANITRRSR